MVLIKQKYINTTYFFERLSILPRRRRLKPEEKHTTKKKNLRGIYKRGGSPQPQTTKHKKKGTIYTYKFLCLFISFIFISSTSILLNIFSILYKSFALTQPYAPTLYCFTKHVSSLWMKLDLKFKFLSRVKTIWLSTWSYNL